MKRLWDVLVLTLAVNFLALAGGIGWLYGSGRLDRARVAKVKEVLLPPPAAPAPPTTQPTPSSDPTTQPTLRLEELLAKQSNLPAGQQVEFIRQTFDAQMAQLERRGRELADLKEQIDLANAKLTADRTALDADRKRLSDQEQQARKLASDQGFQDSLALYTSMPPRQVKSIFLTLSDEAVMRYVEAMPPRTASKVIKEFKSPDEIDRIQRILEKMRKGQPTTQDVKE
jgi:hypothetical protein